MKSLATISDGNGILKICFEVSDVKCIFCLTYDRFIYKNVVDYFFILDGINHDTDQKENRKYSRDGFEKKVRKL